MAVRGGLLNRVHVRSLIEHTHRLAPIEIGRMRTISDVKGTDSMYRIDA
jgi:hypothetical protein